MGRNEWHKEDGIRKEKGRMRGDDKEGRAEKGQEGGEGRRR